MSFSYDNEDVLIDIGAKYNNPELMALYEIVAGMRIQIYIDDVERQKRAESYFAEVESIK